MATDSDMKWILEEAAKPTGFMPNELSVAEFAKGLEGKRLLICVNGYTWHITNQGRAELARLTEAGRTALSNQGGSDQ